MSVFGIWRLRIGQLSIRYSGAGSPRKMGRAVGYPAAFPTIYAAAFTNPLRPLVAMSESGLGNDCLVFGFKQRFREFRLPNDAPQGSTSDRIVKRNRIGYRRCLQTLLHDPVAALLPDGGESVFVRESDRFPSPKEPGVYPTGTSTRWKDRRLGT